MVVLRLQSYLAIAKYVNRQQYTKYNILANNVTGEDNSNVTDITYYNYILEHHSPTRFSCLQALIGPIHLPFLLIVIDRNYVGALQLGCGHRICNEERFTVS